MKNGKILKMIGILSAACILSGCTVNLPAAVSSETDFSEEASFLTSEVYLETSEDFSEGAADEGWSKPEVKESDSDLKSEFVKKSGIDESKIVLFMQDDYDADGSEEAFVLAGTEEDYYGEDMLVNGDIWFIGSDVCEQISGNGAMGVAKKEHTMKMGNTTYVIFDNVYATALVSYAWSVEDGKAVEAPFSKKGQIITDTDEENRFRIMDNSYDMTYDSATGTTIGHTWKTYYFFYNSEDDKVYEYGGTNVDQNVASNFCGIDLIKDYLPKGDQVTSLFIRGNGLLVMNYEHKTGDDIDYYHFIYDWDKESFLDDFGEANMEPQAGTYREALCPEIASYPQIEGPDGTVYGE